MNRPYILWNALSLGVVLLAGAAALAMPFSSDQALLTIYARQITHGAVLYRDLFDIKEPGIFIFYAVGGQLFGFTEIGIHLLELLYWLVFSLFAVIVLRPYFTATWAPTLVPIFSVFVYYCRVGLFDLTQIEILVGFPILLAWWLIDRAEPATRAGLRRYAVAGLVTAAVVLLKPLYVVIVVAFLGYAIRRDRQRGVASADIRRCMAAFALTLVAPLLVVIAYFAAHGQLGRIWWVYAEYVPQSKLVGSRSLGLLKIEFRHFLIGYAPFLILATLGTLHALKHRIRPQWDLVTGMLLWGTLGLIAILVQPWWDYKWTLLTVPIGILAAFGAQALVAMAATLGKRALLGGVLAGVVLGVSAFAFRGLDPQIQTRLLLSGVVGICAAFAAEWLTDPRARRGSMQALIVALGVSIGLTAKMPVYKFRAFMRFDCALTDEARGRFQRAWNVVYRNVDKDLDQFGARLLPGPLHAFGNPIIVFRAHREPAIPFLGQDPHAYDTRAWREMDSDLRSTLPPNIIVDDDHASVIRERFPAIMELIGSKYKVAFIGASGTYYVLR